MKKKIMSVVVALVLLLTVCVVMTACGSDSSSGSDPGSGSYKDGSYQGKSEKHDGDESGAGAGYGEVQLEIKDNKITSCDYKTYELDGTLKDETYGADLSQENRLKAQKAVQASAKYAEMLVEAGSTDKVDAISGATISYDAFTEAVNDALSKAAE